MLCLLGHRFFEGGLKTAHHIFLLRCLIEYRFLAAVAYLASLRCADGYWSAPRTQPLADSVR